MSSLLTLAQTANLEAELDASYRKKELVLAHPAAGDKISYAADGKLLKGEPGVFGVDDRVVVESISIRDQQLRVRAVRAATLIDPKSSQPATATTTAVAISGDITAGEPTAASVASTLRNIFASDQLLDSRSCPVEETARFQEFLAGLKKHPAPYPSAVMMCMPTGGRGYRFGKGLQIAKAIEQPDPQYPENWRPRGKTGSLAFVVRVDERGLVTDVAPIASSDMREAFSAGYVLRRWRFQPAQLDGNPVPMVIRIEINFALY